MGFFLPAALPLPRHRWPYWLCRSVFSKQSGLTNTSRISFYCSLSLYALTSNGGKSSPRLLGDTLLELDHSLSEYRTLYAAIVQFDPQQWPLLSLSHERNRYDESKIR